MNNISKSKQGYKKTKWLFGKEIEIPKEWNIKKFRDISKINPEKIDKEYWNQNILYVDIGSIDRFQIVDYDVFVLTDRPSRAQRIIKKNDVIVSTVRPYLKAFSKIKKDKSNMVCSTGFTVIRTKNKDDGELIFQFIQSKLFEMHMVREMEGLAYPAVTSKVVANSLIPYPIDKHEKQKIASILSGVDALIESTQKIIEKTEMLKRGLMQKILTKGIGHTKFKKVKNFFNKDCDIPNSWAYPKFASLIKINPKTAIDAEFAAYVPMNAVNTNNSKVNYFERRKVSDISNLPKFLEYDVLFARITPSTENGKTALIENFQEIGVASSELTILRCNERVLPKYLYYYMKSYRIRSFAISQMLGTTNRQRVPEYVFEKDLNFELPLLSEQQKIASILSGVDAVRHHNIITSIILRIKFAIFLILCV